MNTGDIVITDFNGIKNRCEIIKIDIHSETVRLRPVYGCKFDIFDCEWNHIIDCEPVKYGYKNLYDELGMTHIDFWCMYCWEWDCPKKHNMMARGDCRLARHCECYVETDENYHYEPDWNEIIPE